MLEKELEEKIREAVVSLPDDKHSYVGVRVGFLGCAYMQLPPDRIIKINP